MPAKSEKQRKLMGMALSEKRGKSTGSEKAKELASGMSKSDLEDFASKSLVSAADNVSKLTPDVQQSDTKPQKITKSRKRTKIAKDFSPMLDKPKETDDKEKPVMTSKVGDEDKPKDLAKIEFNKSPIEDETEVKKSIDEILDRVSKGIATEEDKEKASKIIKALPALLAVGARTVLPKLAQQAGKAALAKVGEKAIDKVGEKISTNKLNSNSNIKKEVEFIEDDSMVNQWRNSSGLEKAIKTNDSVMYPYGNHKQKLSEIKPRGISSKSEISKSLSILSKAVENNDSELVSKQLTVLKGVLSDAAEMAGGAIGKKYGHEELGKVAGRAAAKVAPKVANVVAKHPKASAGIAGLASYIAAKQLQSKNKSKQEAKNTVMKANKNYSRVKALLKVNKAIDMIKGYQPMSNEDIYKTFSDKIPTQFIDMESRPSSDWWNLAINQLSKCSKDPINSASEIWYGKSMDKPIEKKPEKVEKLLPGAILGAGIGSLAGHPLAGAAIGAGAEEVGKKVLGKMKKSAEGMDAEEIGKAVIELFQDAVAEPLDSKVMPKTEPDRMNLHDGTKMKTEELTENNTKTIKTN
jgi:hypothetical protein